MKITVIIVAVLVSSIQAAFIPEETVVSNLEIWPEVFGRDGRIVNGQQSAVGQFPHQALVFISKATGTYQCGGSLISSLYVMSAAHCIIGATAAKVLLGSINRSLMPTQVNAVQVIRLNTYNPNTLLDDISLIKLQTAVAFNTNIKSIRLPALSQAITTYENSVLTVSGFGLTTANQVSTILQYTTVIGISNSACKLTYGSMIVPSILCTKGYPNTNQGICSGDSGGPLIIYDAGGPTVVGIVSFGAASSCVAGYPQGFTRVGYYLNWISSITGIALRN